MDFWEGAILVVGGIWLIGRMSRQSPSHPVAVAMAAAAPAATSLLAQTQPAPVAPLSGQVQPTGTGSTAGLAAGESLGTSLTNPAPTVLPSLARSNVVIAGRASLPVVYPSSPAPVSAPVTVTTIFGTQVPISVPVVTPVTAPGQNPFAAQALAIAQGNARRANPSGVVGFNTGAGYTDL